MSYEALTKNFANFIHAADELKEAEKKAMQLSKEINAKIGEQVSELHWPQWTIESERNEPLFQLRQNIQQFGITFRSRTTQLMRDLQQLSQKVSHYKSKSYKKRTFKFN